MRLRSHSQEAVDPNPGQADSHSAACLPDGLHSDFWGMGIGGVLALVSGQPHTRKESVYPSWGGGGGKAGSWYSFSHSPLCTPVLTTWHTLSPNPIQWKLLPQTLSLPPPACRDPSGLCTLGVGGTHLVALGHRPLRRHEGPLHPSEDKQCPHALQPGHRPLWAF